MRISTISTGGYSPFEEDYRWPIIRQKIHPLLFLVFNLTFISFFQLLLLLSITVPMYAVWLTQKTHSVPINSMDLIAIASFLCVHSFCSYFVLFIFDLFILFCFVLFCFAIFCFLLTSSWMMVHVYLFI